MSNLKKRFLKYVGEDGRLEIHISSLTQEDIHFIIKSGEFLPTPNRFHSRCKSVDIWEHNGFLYYGFYKEEYPTNDCKLFKQIKNGKFKEKLK